MTVTGAVDLARADLAHDPMEPEYADGTRIIERYQYTTTADGYSSKVSAGMFDKALNVQCHPVAADDGITRCMPITSGFSSVGVFADAACTQPVMIIPRCNAVPSIAVLNATAPGCPGYAYSAYSVGAKLTTVYSKSGMTCTVTTFPVEGYDAYVQGAKRPASDFAAVTVMIK